MKESYYFSHDSNARNDAKIVKLRRQLGLEGYAINFCIVEMLREDSSNKLLISSFDDIAFAINTSSEKIKAVVTAYDLFVIDGDYFYSPRLSRSMVKYNELKTKREKAGSKGGLSKAKANLEQTPSKPLALLEQNSSDALVVLEQTSSDTLALKERKGKERKEKEIKVNEIKTPTVDEVISFFLENGYTEKSARTAFSHYEAGDWHDVNGKKVRRWKQKMVSVWFKDENKQVETVNPTLEMEKYRGMKGFDEQIHRSGMYYPNITTDENGNQRINYYPNGYRP